MVPFVGIGRALDLAAGVVLDAFCEPQPHTKPPRVSCAPKEDEDGRNATTMPIGGWERVASEPERRWMRAFVGDGARFTYIPSMANRAHRPEASAGCSDDDLCLHAYVNGLARCPRTLLSEGTLVAHHTNKSVLCVVRIQGRARMFVRCFAQRCRFLPHPRVDARGWTEVIETDLELVRLKTERAPLPPPATPTIEWPPAIAASSWIRRRLGDALCAASFAPPRSAPPPLLLCAHALRPPHCPCLLALRGLLRPTHGHVDVVIAAEHSPRTAAGTSLRLFVRCLAHECAHLERAWVELVPHRLPAHAPK